MEWHFSLASDRLNKVNLLSLLSYKLNDSIRGPPLISVIMLTSETENHLNIGFVKDEQYLQIIQCTFLTNPIICIFF